MQILQDYREYLLKTGKSRNTVYSYIPDVRKFLEYAGEDVSTIRQKDVDKYRDLLMKSGLDEKSIKHNLSSLQSFWVFVKAVKGIKVKAEINRVEADERTRSIYEQFTDLEQYIDFLKDDGKAHLTIANYCLDVTQFLAFIGKDYSEIRKRDIEEYKEHLLELRYEEASVMRKLSSLKSFDRFLLEKCNINMNARAVKNPKSTIQGFIDEERFLSYEEFSKLVQAAERERDYRAIAIFYTLATTGLRVSEMLSLEPEIIAQEPTVINLDGAEFSIITLKVMGKRRTPRQIIMFDGAMKYIKDYLEVRLPTGDRLFTGTRGNLTRRAVYDIVSYYGKRAGLHKKKGHPHNLRHLFCIILIENGVSIEKVADLAGHRSIETTRIYIKTTKRQMGIAIKQSFESLYKPLQMREASSG